MVWRDFTLFKSNHGKSYKAYGTGLPSAVWCSWAVRSEGPSLTTKWSPMRRVSGGFSSGITWSGAHFLHAEVLLNLHVLTVNWRPCKAHPVTTLPRPVPPIVLFGRGAPRPSTLSQAGAATPYEQHISVLCPPTSLTGESLTSSVLPPSSNTCQWQLCCCGATPPPESSALR